MNNGKRSTKKGQRCGHPFTLEKGRVVKDYLVGIFFIPLSVVISNLVGLSSDLTLEMGLLSRTYKTRGIRGLSGATTSILKLLLV